MSRLTKIMLGLAIVNAIASALVMSGIVNSSKFPAFDVFFPLAAIFYGMFLICRMLQKNAAEFDAEERRHHEHTALENHSQSVESNHDHAHHAPMRA